MRGAPPSVDEKLRSEFHYFLSTDQIPVLTIELSAGPLPQTPSLPVEKILETCQIYRLGKRKYVDYFGEALTIDDEDEGKISIYSSSEERLYELAFLAIHSRVGEFLDRRGISRIHALGVSWKNINALVMLPSKGGKSTLLSYLLENPDIKIIADDMPLIDRHGKVLPFPSKISLTKKPDSGVLSKLNWSEFHRAHYPPKWTASLSSVPERIEIHPENNPILLIRGVRLSHGESAIARASRKQMIMPLMEHMIIGIGLPQIMELFLNFKLTDIFKISWHALLRGWCALMLLRNSEPFIFYIGNDKSYNAQLILNLLSEHEG